MTLGNRRQSFSTLGCLTKNVYVAESGGKGWVLRDVRKRYFSNCWADMEDQVLMQAQHAVLTTRNTIQASAVGLRRGDLAHLGEEDEEEIWSIFNSPSWPYKPEPQPRKSELRSKAQWLPSPSGKCSGLGPLRNLVQL